MPAGSCRAFAAVVALAVQATATQISPTYGAESPQALVSAMEKALAADDFGSMMPLISPAGRKELAEDAVTALIVTLNFTDPDKPSTGSASLSPTERDAKRVSHRAAVEVARETLRPHGLDGLLGEAPLSPLSKDVFALALDRTDTVVLMQSLYSALDRISTLLGMERSDEKKLPLTFGNVTGYQVSGDTATAKTDGDTIEFERLDGRWYLKPPDK
jgi:hypothetical protein